MSNLFETVKEILEEDKRFLSTDGTIMRNAVYEAAMKMDPALIKALLNNEETREHFFTDVDGIAVFDKVGFGWVINNKDFLPGSYTRYKNKIGLVNGKEEFISSSKDVELVFPYKDCVLEGGQTKDDQKRQEIFYNELLAPDDVDRLLAAKVFTGAERHTESGKETTLLFSGEDNLVIKGNNLLSISSLLRRYQGQVKCIYIDVPYNTGNDSFGYNDRFNHSSWLTFMKNRLEIAHALLSKDGTIAISVDNYEIAYLLVLLDEIFGKENRKNIITVKRGSVTGAKVINPGVVNIVEYVVLYAKNTAFWKPNRVYAAKGYDDRYNVWINNVDKHYSEWTFTTVLEKWAEIEGIKKSGLKKKYGSNYDVELTNFVIANANNIGRWAALDDNSIGEEAKKKKSESLKNPDKIAYLQRDGANDYYIRNGNTLLFAKDRLLTIDGRLTFSQPISDIWDDVLPNDLHNEGDVDFKKGKKPEKLIGRILELCTDEGDLVVDFFAGSGTTGAVALKMKRHFVLCEQMDYIQETTVARLDNVLSGENRGVSSDTGWNGGGSFVYCELAKLNQSFVERIQDADGDSDLAVIYEEIMRTGFISYKVNPKDIDTSSEDFKSLSLEDKKRLLMDLLDKNQLYVNYCDIDDETFGINDADKTFTKSFYGDN